MDGNQCIPIPCSAFRGLGKRWKETEILFTGFQVFSMYCLSLEISALNRRSNEGHPAAILSLHIVPRVTNSVPHIDGTVAEIGASRPSFREPIPTPIPEGHDTIPWVWHSVGMASRFKVCMGQPTNNSLACVSSELVQPSGQTGKERFEMRSIETLYCAFHNLPRISVARYGQSPSISVPRISIHSPNIRTYDTSPRLFRSWS